MSTDLLVKAVASEVDQSRTVDLLAVSGRVRTLVSAWEAEHPGVDVPSQVFWENSALLADFVRRDRRTSTREGEAIRGLGIGKDGLQDHRLNPLAVDYWCERAAASTNPTARARYADLGWTARATAKDRRAYSLAVVAIDAYLDQADCALVEDPNSPLVDAVDRAAEIASLIRNREKARKVADSSLRALVSLPDDTRPRWSLDLFESLDSLAENFDGLLTPAELELFERTLMAAAAHFEAKSPGDPFLPIEALALAARAAKRLDARDRMLDHRVGMVELLRRAARIREGTTGATGGAFVASTFMEQALHRCQEVISLMPPPDLAARLRTSLLEIRRELRRLIRATGDELKRNPHRVEFEYPAAEREAFVAWLLAKPEEETLRLLSLASFLHMPLRSLEQAAEEAAKTTWVSDLFGTTVFRQGRKVTLPPPRQDPDRRVGDYKRVWLNFHLYDLEFILPRLREAGRLTVAAYLGHFDSWIFLDEADRPFLSTGIERYLSGDYVSAIHVLVPRIEHMLKSAFEQVGLPPIAVPNMSEVREQTFGDFLRRDEVRRALGEGLWTQLCYILVDEQGMNLRNDVAHGWLPADACNRGIANVAVFVPLLLTLLVPTDQVTSTEEPVEGKTAPGDLEDETSTDNPSPPVDHNSSGS